MKRTMKLGVMGLLLAVGVAQSNAQSNWVQNANLTLTVYEAGALKSQSLNAKALLETLSGATSTGGTTTVTNITTNVTAIAASDIEVTNYAALHLSTNNFSTNIFTTNGTLVASNFPLSITVTNVIVTVGTNSTTNTVVLTSSTNSPTTYVFTNTVTSGTNTGYVFTNSYVLTNGTGTNATFTTNPAPIITAVLTTGSTTTNQLVFSFEYSSLTTTTNIVAGTNSTGPFPTFNNKDKLVLVTPLSGPSGPTNPPTFAVAEVSGKTVTLVDVSAYIFFQVDPNVTDVTIKGVDYNLWKLKISANASNGLLTANTTALIKEAFGVKIKNVSYPSLPKNLEADIEGNGSFAGNALIFSGKVTASGGSSGPALTSP
jgi:hypothetical protein